MTTNRVEDLAVTWWGHASVTLEIAGLRVATDPLLSRQLMHLRRASPVPPPAANVADVVLISHLHHDHLHLPSLRRFDPDVPVVVPKGAAKAVRGLRGLHLVEVAPGEAHDVEGLRIDVLPARHDGRRDPLARVGAPALAFRMTASGRTSWYSGDTGVDEAVEAVDPVDLAIVAIGGWGPTLGDDHLSPEQAAGVVGRIGATWSLGVHYGTFWPISMKRAHPRNYKRLFESPPEKFTKAIEEQGVATRPLTPTFGERLDLAPGPEAQRGGSASPGGPDQPHSRERRSPDPSGSGLHADRVDQDGGGGGI
jgi:L-ascorbate metabolism protein UlaG (beta-lactamase superfamily)